MVQRKRRTRSPHSGIVLIPPDPAGRHTSWRARYRDPDSGRLVKVRIDPVACPSAATRRDWAIRKAKSLAKRTMEIEAGAPRATGTPLAEAIETYYKAHPRLRARTLLAYRGATDKLLAWAPKAGVRTVDDLTRPKLLAFRAALANEPKRAPVAGGKRGSFASTGEARSAQSVNRELRAARTVLGYLRKYELLPRLTSDDLRDGLERLEVTREDIDYLAPPECRKLLEAALAHDAATYAETRLEHIGLYEPGSTPRYDPIAPFVAFELLTGMRLGEAVSLDWPQVDLDALDQEGRKVGEIKLSAAMTKTKRGRKVGLEVSPLLRELLTVMRERTGGIGSVFGLSRTGAEAAQKRLRRDFGAPAHFSWQALRRTCGTYLTNSFGIFGAASAYRSAKQLGHSVEVAEKFYVEVARGISRDARTLEDAMQIRAEIERVIDAEKARPARRTNKPEAAE